MIAYAVKVIYPNRSYYFRRNSTWVGISKTLDPFCLMNSRAAKWHRTNKLKQVTLQGGIIEIENYEIHSVRSGSNLWTEEEL